MSDQINLPLMGFHHQLQKSVPSGTNYKLSLYAPLHRFIKRAPFSTKRKRDRENIMRAQRINILIRNMTASLCGFDCKKVINCQFLPFISKIRPTSPVKLCIILICSIWTSTCKKMNKSYWIFFH